MTWTPKSDSLRKPKDTNALISEGFATAQRGSKAINAFWDNLTEKQKLECGGEYQICVWWGIASLVRDNG